MSEHKDTFVKVDPHLYKWQHRMKSGEYSTKYYALFTCEKYGKPRRVPLGTSDLEAARRELKNTLELTKGGFDFGAVKKQRKQAQAEANSQAVEGLTFREWAMEYFWGRVHYKGEELKRQKTKDMERRCFDRAARFFGNMRLTDIDAGKCYGYVAHRTADMTKRDGKRRKISVATAGADLKFVKFLLHRAQDHSKITKMPNIEIASARKHKRRATEAEYQAQLAAMKKTTVETPPDVLMGVRNEKRRAAESYLADDRPEMENHHLAARGDQRRQG